MSERTNKNLPARNTLVQLLALYTDPESHNAQRYRQTDGQMDDMMMPIADHNVRSAKKNVSYKQGPLSFVSNILNISGDKT